MSEDYVNLERKGPNRKREVQLTPEDLLEIRENPNGLTEEGCLVKIAQWAMSNNQHVLTKYLTLFKRCKNFEKSGVTDDGRIVLSRRKVRDKLGIERVQVWAEKELELKEAYGDFVSLKKQAVERCRDLAFLTTKGNPRG